MFIWKCASLSGQVKAESLKQVLDSARKKLAKSKKAGRLVRIEVMSVEKEKEKVGHRLGEWSVRVPKTAA